MRFKITFNRTGKQRMLPVDYQYYLSAWIYKVIARANPEFARFLHGTGYSDGKRQFKLFSYSPLDFGRPQFWKEKSLFEINSNEISLQVSFYLPEAAEYFIIGLFNNQQLFVGDKFNGIDLTVSQIERLPEWPVAQMMRYRAISPVVISVKAEGEKYSRYLSPLDITYQQFIRNNLEQKWKTIPQEMTITNGASIDFALMNQPKSKLITIKPYTPEESKVRGYLFDFSLTAPVEIQQMVLASGIGEKNSMGFGWVEPMLDAK